MTAAPGIVPHAGLRGQSAPWISVGRTLLHPVVDYLIIGGGLSLLVGLLLQQRGASTLESLLNVPMPLLILLSNSAHFASSTVRLYAKPRAFEEFRFLTMAFPLITVAVLTLAILFPRDLGGHLQALYLTWSPYHYAAQAYGLCLLYCYRSGGRLSDPGRLALRAACLAPFAYAFLNSRGAGIEWFVPASLFSAHPWLHATRALLIYGLGVATFALPLGTFVVLRLREGTTLPLISVLVVLANGIWWIGFVYMRAFVWATVFHGLQYLAIVTIFHVKDRMSLPQNTQGWPYHAVQFYLASVALGYCLFSLWPYAYVAAGFGLAESVLLVAATINVHHFIVDAYIWRLRMGGNYRIVADVGAPA